MPDESGTEVLTPFTPGVARERFVLEVFEVRESGRALGPDEWVELYRRHDQYQV